MITGVFQNGKLSVEVLAGAGFIEVSVNPDIAPNASRSVPAAGSRRPELLAGRAGEPPVVVGDRNVRAFSDDGDLLIQYQGMLKKIRPAEQFSAGNLRKGDEIGFDLWHGWLTPMWNTVIATSCFWKRRQAIGSTSWGGWMRKSAQIKHFLSFRLEHAEVAASLPAADETRYFVHGAPGNGKTKLRVRLPTT